MATRKSEGGSRINPKAAMETELIVEHMIRFLNLSDLKRFRLVNKLWSREGGKEMLLKSCFTIPPKFHKKKETEQEIEQKILLDFLHPKPNQSETLNGQNEESKKRKVLALRIHNPLDIEILQAIQFPFEFLQHFRFPPLSEIRQSQNQRNLYSSGLKEILPSFKSLISLEIVKSGDRKMNTTKISPSVEEIAIFGAAGKLDLVTFFEFKVDGRLKMPMREQVEVLEMFAAQNPRLDYIVIGYRMRRMAATDPALFSRFLGALNHTLNSSRESLTVLEMTDCLSDVGGLVIPALENLKSLVILLPSNRRIHTPAFPALEESSFSSLRRVSIGCLEWDWTFRKLLRQVDPSAISVLLPGLNPNIKHSPHLVESQKGGRNRLLIFSSDSEPDSDFDSASECKNLVVDANDLLQYVDDHDVTVDRFLFVLKQLFIHFVMRPLLSHLCYMLIPFWLLPSQPSLQLLTETTQLGNETLILLNTTLGSLNQSGVLELEMNLDRLEKSVQALEEFPWASDKGPLFNTQIVQYILTFHQGFSLAHAHVKFLREELGMQNPGLDNMFRRLAWRNSRSLLEILKEQDENEALLKDLGELLRSTTHEPRTPVLYCEAEDLTLKIPPRFICPLLLNSSTTAAAADALLFDVKNALFHPIYQPITCQE